MSATSREVAGVGARLAAVLFSTLAACQLLADLEPVPVEVDARKEETTPPIPCVEAPLPGACDRFPPCPPRNTETASNEHSFVLSRVSMFNANTAEVRSQPTDMCLEPGLDLDGKTTCYRDGQLSPYVKCDPDDECAGACVARGPREVVCDTATGIDNAISKMLNNIVVSKPTRDRLDPEARVREGAGNMILKLSGYNELADDDDVELVFLTATGLATVSHPITDAGLAWLDASGGDATTDADAPIADAGLDADGGDVSSLAWDGWSRRTWTRSPAEYLPSNKPVGRGYVRNYVLVATDLEVTIELTYNAPFTFYKAQLRAELRRRPDGDWELVKGRIGGQVPTDIAVDGTQKLLCMLTEDERLGAVELVCTHRDLPAEGQGLDTPCDSITAGIRFKGAPADLGSFRDRRNLPSQISQCPPEFRHARLLKGCFDGDAGEEREP